MTTTAEYQRRRNEERRFDPAIRTRMLRSMDKTGVDYRHKGDYIYTKCPFHMSLSNSKSFWITPSGRKVGCWSCKYEGNWNDYAEEMKLQKFTFDAASGQITEGDNHPVGYIRGLMDDISDLEKEALSDLSGITLPRMMNMPDRSWRGISKKMLLKVGARIWYDDKSRYERILLPAKQDDRIVGYVAGRWDLDIDYSELENDPKYRNSSGPWSKTTFYGLDQTRKTNVIVLVEGGYDRLRLLMYGIPAIANYGADTAWSSDKLAMLQGRTDLDLVIVLTDRDKAGRRAGTMITEELLDGGVNARYVTLPAVRALKKKGQSVDPGNVPEGWLRAFRDSYMKKQGWNGRFKLKKLKLPKTA